MNQQQQPNELIAKGYATQFFDESNMEAPVAFEPIGHGSKDAAIARAKDITARREGVCIIYVDGVPYGGFRDGQPASN